MNVSRSELHALRSERAAYAQAVKGVREATGLHDVSLADLPAMVEALLSELADRQIQSDVGEVIGDGSGEALPPVSEMQRIASGIAAMDPEDDEWAPEDTVVPRQGPSCRGCVGLAEIDGRLMCMDARSQHYGGGITWPGPGCVWASAGDAVYGGGRG
jgi:hypothetical protein